MHSTPSPIPSPISRCRRAPATVVTLSMLFLVLAFAPPVQAQRVLFDARHGQTAGNADWIVDADSSQQVWSDFRCQRTSRHHSPQRFPTPPQSEIRLDTPETFWDGGISAWAVDLAKDALDPARDRTWQIEQYPWDGPHLTFGDPSNPQDLANYDVLILCEPNVLFTAAEAQAVREFVFSGGGLFLCADHETSDRNCSGGGSEVHDSPFILNRLMQTDVETRRTPPYFDPLDPANDYGVFGIWFYENDNDDPSDANNRAFDWFTEGVNDNVSPDPGDPILHGPFGDGTGGIGLFGSTQMAVSSDPERGNPTARGHIWRNGASRDANAGGVSEQVTFASARYGAGRVVAVGDSSPADDDTGEGSLHPGWDKAVGGVANHVVFLNATEWIANPQPDLVPPVITGGPDVAPADCSATVTWVTDEAASSTVRWREAGGRDGVTTASGFGTGHRVQVLGLQPLTRYDFQVESSDPAGNGPTVSAEASFTTTSPSPIGIEDPVQHVVTPFAITLSWRTAKPTTAEAEATTAGALAAQADGDAPSLDHTLTLEGLTPATDYTIEITARDGCGQTETRQLALATSAAPAEVDLSGWRLVNDNPAFEYVFPEGTRLAAGGYLVLGRANDRAGFETEWGLLDPAVAYLDSGDSLVVNATPRPYTLLDAQGAAVDGPTVEVSRHRSWSRQRGCTDAGIGAAWTDRSSSAADPGRGAPAPCGAGVVITEISDAGDFRNEFVEIHLDLGGETAPPPNH